MKKIQSFYITAGILLLLGTQQLLTQNSNAENEFTAVADTSAIPDSLNTQNNIFLNSADLFAPCDSLSGPNMKIFVPDTLLTSSMPILVPPLIDEGIFIPYIKPGDGLLKDRKKE